MSDLVQTNIAGVERQRAGAHSPGRMISQNTLLAALLAVLTVARSDPPGDGELNLILFLFLFTTTL